MTHANTIGNFNPATPLSPVHLRPEAWCSCGAKLSRYRPPMTSLCWLCEAQKLAAASVVE